MNRLGLVGTVDVLGQRIVIAGDADHQVRDADLSQALRVSNADVLNPK